MKNIPMWKYTHEIQKLVHLADINFLVCKEIYHFLPKDRIKANKFLLLSANNAFNEAVSILHTLLCSTKEEELTIKPLLKEIIEKEKSSSLNSLIVDKKLKQFIDKITKDYPLSNYFTYDFLFHGDNRLIGDILSELRKKKRQSGLEDLNILKTEFESKNFHKIRHQSTAHKNKLLKDPSGSIDLYLKYAVIDELGKIVKNLRIQSYFWFDYQLQNPFFSTTNDLEAILELYKVEI